MLVRCAPFARGYGSRRSMVKGFNEGPKMTDKTMTRRDFMGHAAVAIPVAAILNGGTAAAATAGQGQPLPKLDVNDPVAKALMYTLDASKVDPAKAPTFKPGSDCANCVQLQAGTGDWRGCNAFPGKLVALKGWCSAWAAKPA
jgi:hypothetical protein